MREEKALQEAYSKKEKYEKLLSNLEKLREEGSVTDEQYESMKSNYIRIINEATSTIEQTKNRIRSDIERGEKTIEVYEQELRNLEARFKVGELSADEYRKSEQRARDKIEKERARILELKRLLESKSSADVGGYIEVVERKGAKAIGVGMSFPALGEILASKKILFGIIGLIAVVIIIGVVLVGFGERGFGENPAKSVMKQLPEDTYFTYIDLKTLREDKDLAPLWESLEESESAELERIGIELEELDFSGGSGSIVLVGGDFDLENIRYKLDDEGYDESRYRDVEIWEKGGWWGKKCVALLGDKIIIGSESSVKDAIRVMKGEKKSFYERNSEMASIMDRLPSGFMVAIMPGGGEYKGLESMGSSIQKMNARRLKIQSIFMFDDKYSAKNAEDDIIEDFEEKEELRDVEVSVQDRYVTVTGTFKIEDFENIRGYWW